MDDLSQATRQQTHAMLIIHCTERYHKINSELDGELETFARLHVSRLQARDRHLERLPGVPYNTASQHLTEKLVRHYLTYWLLQWDQYTYYHNGMLPAWAFEGWLLQRWEDYNFYNAILYNLPNSVQADEEADKSMRTASARQDFYRDGWKTAKRFYSPLKKGFHEFAVELEVLMSSDSPDVREAALQKLLKTDFTRRTLPRAGWAPGQK